MQSSGSIPGCPNFYSDEEQMIEPSGSDPDELGLIPSIASKFQWWVCCNR